MLETLPEEVRRILLSYKFIEKYFKGRYGRDDFVRDLQIYKIEISDRIPSQYNSHKYIGALILDAGTNEASYNRFARFVKKLGLTIASPQDKVNWIKNTPNNKIFDWLSVSNSLLRGHFRFVKWSETPSQSMIPFNFEPPKNAHIEFEKFLTSMKNHINIRNLQFFGAKFFIAIIFAHMFPDGNGRLARNVYYILRTHGILSEEKSSERDPIISDFCATVNGNAIYNVFRIHGINLQTVSQIELFQAQKGEDDLQHYINSLKYLAARQVLISKKVWNEQDRKIQYGNWSQKLMDEFDAEYQRVRVEWFWQGINLIDQYGEWSVRELDRALIQ